MAGVSFHVCAFAHSHNHYLTREAALTNTATKHQVVRQDISRRDLEVIMSTAASYSRKLSRSLKLSRTEEEDVEQDILVVLLERWHYFDGALGSNIGFAIRVARQAIHAIAQRIVADRSIEALGLDQLQDVDDLSSEVEALTLADMLADDAAPTEAMIVHAISVGRFFSLQPEDYALVARAIREQDGDLAEAQRLTGLSSSEFYRRLRELRYRLVCLELAPRDWLTRP